MHGHPLDRSLRPDEERYARHIVLDGFGMEGQQKVRQAKVFVAGIGGLGSPAITYLVMAGVGTIGIADDETVEVSNLNRQFLHDTEDIGRRKTESAAAKIARLNPDVKVIPFIERLDRINIEGFLADFDIVIDATDNVSSRFLISDCGYRLGKPVIECGVSGYEGILMTIIPGQTPCYRCLFPVAPPDTAIPSGKEAGILGMVAGIFGTMQALEAIKLILGLGAASTGQILTFDAVSGKFRHVPWSKRPDCPLCGSSCL